MGNDRHDIFRNTGPGVPVDVLYDMRVIEDLVLLRQLKRTSIGQVGKVDPEVKGLAGRWFCSAGSEESDGRNSRGHTKNQRKWHWGLISDWKLVLPTSG